jgi:Leucine Rich repeat
MMPLDLSYLFRTKSSSLAAAIQQLYNNLSTTEKESPVLVDVDLTSSLVDKNFTEVLAAAISSNRTHTATILLKLSAKRNQWTSKEGSSILQFLLDRFQAQDLASEFQGTAIENTDEPTNSAIRTQDDETAFLKDDIDSNTTVANDTNVTVPTTETTIDNPNVDADGKLQDEARDAPTGTAPTSPRQQWKPTFVLQSLDLGWNYLGGGSSRNVKSFHQSLQQLVGSPLCPSHLNLEMCGLSPAACRSMAKGILERHAASPQDAAKVIPVSPAPLSLNLACNDALGDGGVAALAAAIRTVASQRRSKDNDHGDGNDRTTLETLEDLTVLDTLDLSACSITDAGVEALAVALEKHPLCVRYLDLSNNDISDEGAASLARALLVKNGDRRCGKVLTLNLSNNKRIGDRGAKELSEAFQEGCIENMILRSCHLHADGAACFGKAMRALATRRQQQTRNLSIDLSGNPLGILRKKAKSGNKYSASALKSKATETTAAYMNLIGKTVQKGLKDLGLAESGNGLDTLESDDEEEERMGKNNDEDDDSKNKCGGLSLAEAFIVDDEEEDEENLEDTDGPTCLGKLLIIQLGLRHCSLDTRAAEALAAVLQESRKKGLSMNLTFDMRMNDVLEEDIVAALHGESEFEDKISEMAENYLDAVEVIREAQQRALEAARIARARARAETERDEAWGTPVGVRASGDGWDDYDGDEWESDAHYDPPGEDEDDYWS